MGSIQIHEHNAQNHRKSMLWIFGAVCIALLGACAFFYWKYQEVLHTPNQAEQLVSQLSSTIALPNQTPTLLTISNKSKLTNTALANEVQNGDQLLVYDAAKKIIIYRPSLKKVISILNIAEPVTEKTKP